MDLVSREWAREQLEQSRASRARLFGEAPPVTDADVDAYLAEVRTAQETEPDLPTTLA